MLSLKPAFSTLLFHFHQNHSISSSSALLIGAYTWLTVLFNGLPWKRTLCPWWLLPAFLGEEWGASPSQGGGGAGSARAAWRWQCLTEPAWPGSAGPVPSAPLPSCPGDLWGLDLGPPGVSAAVNADERKHFSCSSWIGSEKTF